MLSLLLILLCAATPASAEDVAFVGATILPVSGPPIDAGVLHVRDGTIVALGSAEQVILPAGVRRIDVAGRTIMPGLVDLHSHIGGSSASADRSAPIQPDVRAADGIDPQSAGLHRARAAGITTVNIMPGSGWLVGGQTAYIKLRRVTTIDELLIRDAGGAVLGGLKMANGSNPLRDPPFPGTRGKAAALVRDAFLKAQHYGQRLQRAAAATTTGEPPDRDLGHEVLLEALRGTRVVHHHTHTAADIASVLRLAEEFKFPVVLHHVSEGWKIPERIAQAGAACAINVVDSPGGKEENSERRLETPAILHRAGVAVAICSDDPVTDCRFLRRMAGLALRGGLPRDEALRAITLTPATLLRLNARIGSLAPGKDADFVILSGDPLSVYTTVLQTWVEGRLVFDSAEPADRVYSVGGRGGGERRRPPMCCFDTHDPLRGAGR
jgi:imidazolonepropionase-like amidohydrolase